MGNRRRPRNPALAEDSERRQMDIPMLNQVVQKKVPAVIHFSQVEGTDREDDEIIGESIIYEDGTSDIVVFADISPEAKQIVRIIQGRLDGLNIETT